MMDEPRLDSPSYLRWHSAKEFQLVVGSLWVLAMAAGLMVVLAAVGYQLAGDGGLRVGENVGLGASAFAICGMVIHFVRFWVILIYQRLLFKGQDPVLMDAAPPPSEFMHRWVDSSDWDFAFQACVGVVVALICFRLSP